MLDCTPLAQSVHESTTIRPGKDWSDSAKSTQSTHKPQSPALRALGCILHAALGREDKLRGTLDGMSGDTPDSPLYIIRMAALGVVYVEYGTNYEVSGRFIQPLHWPQISVPSLILLRRDRAE